MPGLSIHVVDVSRGVVGAGMRIVVRSATSNTKLADGVVNASGLLDVATLAERLERGSYEVDFYIAVYYRGVGIKLPVEPFLDIVTYRFGIDDPTQHYHLPFKCTPWGYSCFRGGA